MPPLPTELLTTYENAVVAAREAAEVASRAALTVLAVADERVPEAMPEERRRLRRALRARARQLGGGDQDGGMPRLVEEIAYEQWHRLLFARFLAENRLLMHPAGVAVTLDECAELAPEEGAEDRWELAARYAVGMLPGIFALEDPAMQVRFAPEGRQRLEQIVMELPRAVFTSDDGLGWAYQFWQSKKKDEVNASERKIGGADLYPVTQLFTEDYMVKFLLHNSLGAWWAARHPESPLVATFDYLRFKDDGTPAAGTFDGWPQTAAEVTVMDPCCGSGHFVVAAFEMLLRMRMEEEGLSDAEAGDAVIRDNVFGLEIDPRCTQIAAFNLALVAWKTGGYHPLPLPNIACSGIPIHGKLDEWLKVAKGDTALEWALEWLHNLFRNAPDLGSLINPSDIPTKLQSLAGGSYRVEAAFDAALRDENVDQDPTAALFGYSLSSIVRTANLLSLQYNLVSTNVPYLLRRKQAQVVADYCEQNYSQAKTDLATVFVGRCLSFCHKNSSVALVTPVHWLLLGSYQGFREDTLRKAQWELVAMLGPGAFRTISGEIVNVVLLILTDSEPQHSHMIAGLDVAAEGTVAGKAVALKQVSLATVSQIEQLGNPDGRVTLEKMRHDRLLEDYADSLQGIVTGDLPRYGRFFWEVPKVTEPWRRLQGAVKSTIPYGGRESVLLWESDGEDLAQISNARIQGMSAWGKRGVCIRQTGDLPATLYTGEVFDINTAAIIPKNPSHLEAIWAFCSSQGYSELVRQIDRQIKVTNATLAKVPFNLEHWSAVAQERGPIPSPYSDDPTQWLFDGQLSSSTAPLQVAVAYLAGYRWPEHKVDGLQSLSNAEGQVCVPAISGRVSAAAQLRVLLASAFGSMWSLECQHSLLAGVGYGSKGMDSWLRDGFFEQHCQLFQNRPFIWHIWDGRPDGFSVLVNYHKLDTAGLEKLIYTYLGDWIQTQQGAAANEVAGAEGRLVAALALKAKLEAILVGEPPYDIYVRWKPLHEQPIGWNPDLNDGVRLNIRPFVEAGVLRKKFTINWKKDRGKNPDGSDRENDRHFTRAEKEAARRRVRHGRHKA